MNIAEEICLDSIHIAEIGLAGLLHDVGKFIIPSKILDKPYRLSVQEYNCIKIHSQRSAIFAKNEELITKRVLDIIYCHHERWDGRGYPMGLNGNETPLGARILAIADTYDALSSMRPYRENMTTQEVFNEISLHSGSQFDPNITKSAIEALKKLSLFS